MRVIRGLTYAIFLFCIGCKNNNLHSSKIEGIIKQSSYSIGDGRNYTSFKIDKKQYKLKIISAPGNEFSFMDVARNGDTVFKAANSDTLFVRRTGYNGDIRLPFIVKEYISK